MAVTLQNQRPTGMPCPICGEFIYIDIHELLVLNSWMCPGCKRIFVLDRAKSQKALQSVSKLVDSFDKVEKSSHFNGR